MMRWVKTCFDHKHVGTTAAPIWENHTRVKHAKLCSIARKNAKELIGRDTNPSVHNVEITRRSKKDQRKRQRIENEKLDEGPRLPVAAQSEI